MNDEAAAEPGTRWAAGPPLPPALVEVLEESRRRSLIGPTDLDQQVAHSRGFIACVPSASRVLDLGSGGGLPGLALAVGRPELKVTLLDSAARRVRFLEWAVEALDCADRVEVVHARAEDAARSAELRGGFDGVMARSFGPPAVTAECGRSFLETGGYMVVSEPPGSDGGQQTTQRWPAPSLSELGLEPEYMLANGYSFVRLKAVTGCPSEVPRRAGLPAKRPLF